MPRQRQVDDALRRAFNGQPPAGKVSASITEIQGRRVLTLMHYHHELLCWRLPTATEPAQIVRSWHEKPTDKRVLDAALQALAEDYQQPASCAGSAGRHLPARAASSSALLAGAHARPAEEPEERGVRRLGRHGALQFARGRSVEEQGSRFVAAALWPIADANAASAAIACLRAEETFAAATHRIAAFCALDGADGCDDDGEERAGAALRAELRKERVVGAAVVVARWYGGVNIGKARFRHVQERATTLLQACGHQAGRKMGDPELQWERLGSGVVLGGASSTVAAASDGSSFEAAPSDPIDAAVQMRQRRELAAAAAERRASSRGGSSASITASQSVKRNSATAGLLQGHGVTMQASKRSALESGIENETASATGAQRIPGGSMWNLKHCQREDKITRHKVVDLESDEDGS
eukprot:TRINITY_DN54122_c0_g1_i1.p1 TRINITY_DN54122_c0_g1~~TRINITY_DN54122_c0_g1_i1.p1  ORF type:complete len:412 (-),score=69.86 TRINITY_DN54122_c0_g1_i1:258-1493(-)